MGKGFGINHTTKRVMKPTGYNGAKAWGPFGEPASSHSQRGAALARVPELPGRER